MSTFNISMLYSELSSLLGFAILACGLVPPMLLREIIHHLNSWLPNQSLVTSAAAVVFNAILQALFFLSLLIPEPPQAGGDGLGGLSAAIFFLFFLVFANTLLLISFVVQWWTGVVRIGAVFIASISVIGMYMFEYFLF